MIFVIVVSGLVAVGTSQNTSCSPGGVPCGPGCCPTGFCTDGGFCNAQCLFPSVPCRNSFTGDTKCVLTDRDPANCGSCNEICTVGSCISGVCQCPTAFPDQCVTGFPPNERKICTSLQSDPLNCGSCNIGCIGGNCTNGQCTPPFGATFCPDQQTGIGGKFVNLLSDPSNCAVCGRQCLQSVCINGRCVLPGKSVLIDVTLEETTQTDNTSTTTAWSSIGAGLGVSLVLALASMIDYFCCRGHLFTGSRRYRHP